MPKVNPSILKTLRYRFENQVSEADILSWLYNFQEDDWEKALILLSEVVFYSTNRMFKTLEDGLQEVLNQTSQQSLLFFPVGEIGKSGGMIAYGIQKILKERFPKVSYRFYDESTIDNKTDGNIIYIDDFLGTGKSLEEYHQKVSLRFPKGMRFFCLVVAYMERAQKRLQEIGISVYGDRHLPVFRRRGSIFGYEPRMRIIKNFAQRYGSLLYPRRDFTVGMDYYIGPLGYANSQALICFEHTTPNNTLPILWSSKNRRDSKEKWIPLFPRRLYDRIQRDTDFKQCKYKWLNIAQKISKGNINRPFNDYSKDSIYLLGLLHCLYHHRSRTYTRFLLELTEGEMNLVIRNGQKKGLCDKEENITTYGKDIYLSIRKNQFRPENMLVAEKNVSKKCLYLPSRFLGIPRYNSVSEESLDFFNL